MSRYAAIALLLFAATRVHAQGSGRAGGAIFSHGAFAAASEARATGGDPIDLYTGLYVRTTVDLKIDDTVPIELSRTYRNFDHRSRSFGVGTSHPYDMFIVGDAVKFTYVELIRADGSRIHYDRISRGTGYADGVFEDADDPTEFFHSLIRWNGSGWTVTLTNGSSYKVLGCSPGTTVVGKCGVIEFSDSNGQTVHVERAANGNVSRVLSPNGKWLKFTYDAENRVTQAEASTGDVVHYRYDDRGRLIEVTVPDQDEPLAQYGYDDDDRMTDIFEGNRKIQNTYDHEYCVHQIVQSETRTYEFAFQYIVDAQDRHIATEVRESDGTLRRVVFNDDGYPVTDTYASVDEPGEAALVMERDPRTNGILSLKVTCSLVAQGIPVTVSIGPLQDGEDPRAQQVLALCRRAVTSQQP